LDIRIKSTGLLTAENAVLQMKVKKEASKIIKTFIQTNRVVKEKKMKKLISIILCLMMLVSCMACGAKETEPKEEVAVNEESKEDTKETESADSIVVALCGPTTGNNAYSGQAMLNGATLRIDEYNENGGYNGRMIEIQLYDTKADANEGVTIAQKIVGDGEAMAVIGPWSSTVAMAMAPVTSKAEILMYAPTPTHDDLTGISEW